MEFIKGIYKKYPKLFWLPIFLLILLASTSVILTFSVMDESSRVIVSDVASPIYNIVATIALIAAAIYSRKVSKRLALGWAILAIAQFSFTMGDILWGYIELIQKGVTFPSIADGAYLLFYPLFLVGVLFFPRKRFSSRDWTKKALDTCIIMVTAVLGYWIFLIGPILTTESDAPILEKILSLAYPIGDLILLFAILVIIYYRSDKINLGSAWILAVGLIAMIATDSIFSYQSLMGTYATGGILDCGWFLSYILIAVAGIFQIVAVKTYSEEGSLPHPNQEAGNKISSSLSYIPYVAVLCAYYLLLTYHTSDLQINSNTLLIGVGCIIGFVIIRQLIVLRENNDLLSIQSKTLEQLKSQAIELDQTNIELQQEIIERKRIETQLSHDALHDGLTDLANRALFIDRLRHAIEVSKRKFNFCYSILYLDLDNFKSINDRLGHAAGDVALIEVSERLRICTRTIDTVARFGGDEFVVLLENTPDSIVDISVANRILSEIERPITVYDKQVLITCSIGIVQGISEYANSEDVVRDADIAMYYAKARGKSRYEIFNVELRTSTLSRLEIENDLAHAITHDELFLNYQPIYCLKDSKIVGFEALVRWQHPVRGLIMPSEFIKIAEDSGVIVQLGDWVLYQACAQMKKWHNQYPGSEFRYVSVNISGKQLAQKDFVNKVKENLHLSGLDPQRLKLEITENAFIENQSLVNGLISDLGNIGVEFFIDDFGTGYSSLSYLKNFVVKTIKIDKTFINDILVSNKGYEIIKTIILMAQGMGIDAVAEGIENFEQLQKLNFLNCTYGQGFYLAMPANAVIAEKIFERQTGSLVQKLELAAQVDQIRQTAAKTS